MNDETHKAIREVIITILQTTDEALNRKLGLNAILDGKGK